MAVRGEGKGKGKGAEGRKPARVVQNGTKKPANDAQKERAAVLLAEGKLTDELIADELEIGRTTLSRWKLEPRFQESVKRAVEEIRAALVARGIVERQNRLDALNDRHRRMAEVIRQRALNLKSIPGGGDTGLLVRQVKGIGKGEDFQVVEEYAVDTALLREMREHEKQAAIELGEWSERHEHTGKDGARLVFTLKLDNAGSFDTD